MPAPVVEWLSAPTPVGEWLSMPAPVDEWLSAPTPVGEWLSVPAPVGEWLSMRIPVGEWLSAPTPVGEWGEWLSVPSVSESSSAAENGRTEKSVIHPNILCRWRLDLAGFSTVFSPPV